MLVKCTCQSCGQRIEFATEQAGEQVNCPGCSQPVKLTIPRSSAVERPASKFLTVCQDCHGQISQRALMCPHCGSTAGIRFKLVWDVMCHVGMCALIFAFIAWIFGTIADMVLAGFK